MGLPDGLSRKGIQGDPGFLSRPVEELEEWNCLLCETRKLVNGIGFKMAD